MTTVYGLHERRDRKAHGGVSIKALHICTRRGAGRAAGARYMLINRGFAAFRPQEDNYSKCCPTSFLAFLTSNAKFESYAESDLFLSGSTFRTRGHWDSARQDGYMPTNA